jgi:hypothetical protein
VRLEDVRAGRRIVELLQVRLELATAARADERLPENPSEVVRLLLNENQ